MDWMCFKFGYFRSNSFLKLWIIICILKLQLDWATLVNAQCKEQPLCSYMASVGECENDPEYMLQECPRSCKNPCICQGSSKDTACDCIVKAKNGYCADPMALTDCHSTCTQVIHDSCPLLPVPADPNARLSTWSTNYLTTVTEVCVAGYIPVEPDNQGKKTCSSGPKWVDDPYNGNPVQCTLVDCGPPPTAPNSFSGPTNTAFGSTADYSCAGGYSYIQGQKTLTCNASGLWEGEIIVCQRVDCGPPPSSANASFKVTNSSSGQIATYTCSLGFKATQGDTILRCRSNGVWQGNVIVCTEIDCGPPPSSPNSQVVVLETTYGKTANFTCLGGYNSVEGQAVLTCNASGAWDPTPLVCDKVNCGQPPSTPNTDVAVNNTSYGDTANYTCTQGYVYDGGDMILTCGPQETWEGVLMSCIKVNCGQPPSTPNTDVAVNNTSYGDTANYTCTQGYVYDGGDMILTCGSQRTWEGVLMSCIKVNCGQPPSTPNTDVAVNNTSYGDTANYTCTQGYVYDGGDMILTCGSQRTWEGVLMSCIKVNCGQPPSTLNTYMVVNNTSYGDTANYTCTQGYVYDGGDMILTCGSQGTWEGVLMSCIKVNCGQPPFAPNTDVAVNNTSYGDTANYTCTQGYTYDGGDKILTCGSQGTWEGVLMSCIKVNCGQPPFAPDTDVAVNNTSYGDTANYTCTQGYVYDGGDMMLTCGSRGTWAGVLMSCIKIDCGQPPSAPHADVTVNKTAYGDTATYTCIPGYAYEKGDMILTCGLNGTWEGVLLSCTKISCGKPPNATNAGINTTGTLYGDTATYTCLPGYTVVHGDMSLKCDVSGDWVGVPITCQKIDCGQPLPAPHADVTVNKTSYGDTANYTCIPGYAYDKGNAILTCGWNGTWKGVLLSCTKISCGKPPIATNASVNTTGNLYGDTAIYTCLPGYVVSGDRSLKCDVSGDWVGVPVTCQKIDCGQPPPAPHADVTVNKTSYGDTANYTCIPGYAYDKGDTILTCGWNGTWKGVLLSCTKISCGKPPNATNASVNTTGNLYGDTAIYTCLPGYVVSGDRSLKCDVSGDWVGVPVTCQKIDCGQPPPAPHADVTVNKTSYGDTANYTCIPGYAYDKGDTILTCGWNGTWKGVLLSCTKISCGKPPNATNASVNTTGNLYGDTAIYTCLPGYTVVRGDRSLKCDASGDWVGVPVTCQIIDCGDPPKLAYTDFQVSGTTFNQSANYSCQIGYLYHQGQSILVCGVSSKWMGSALKCKIVNCGPPPKGKNLATSYTSTTFGQKVIYSCLARYKFSSGDRNLTCSQTGNWSGQLMTCVEKDCGVPEVYNSSEVKFTATTQGSQATYTCSVGSGRVSGDFKRVCQDNEIWSGRPVTCNPNSTDQMPTSSHKGLDAPVAWAIGVAVFAAVATVTVLCFVVDCGVLRKRSKFKKNNISTFRTDVNNSMPNFHLTTKWKPGAGNEARLIPSSPSVLPSMSSTPSIRSLRTKDFLDGKSHAKSNNLHPTQLRVSNSQSQLFSPSVSPVTPRTSMSISNSPSGITLSSLSETTLRNPMPEVGS